MPRQKLTDEQRRTGSHLPRGLRDKIRRHEERHQRCARAFGADIYWEFDDHGGASFWFVRDAHLEPVQRAAILYAGSSGSWWAASGCDLNDEKLARRWLKEYPWGEREAMRREAYRLARKHA